MLRRQGSAAHFFHFRDGGGSRDSSYGIGLDLELVWILTVRGARAQIGGEFCHCLRISFFLCVFFLPVVFLCLFGPGPARFLGGMPGVRDKNSRNSSFLERWLVAFVILGEIGVGNFVGVGVQCAIQVLGEQLQAGVAHFFRKLGCLVEAPFLRRGRHF